MNPQTTVFQAATLKVSLELPVDVIGQVLALPPQLVDQGRVVLFDELVQQCLLGLMACIGSVAKAIPALCQHAGCVSETNGSERTSLWHLYEDCHIRSAQ